MVDSENVSESSGMLQNAGTVTFCIYGVLKEGWYKDACTTQGTPNTNLLVMIMQ